VETTINQADLEMVEATLRLARSARGGVGTLSGPPLPTTKAPATKGGGKRATKPAKEGSNRTAIGDAIIEVQIRHLDAQIGAAEKLLKQWRTIQLALGTLAVLLVAFLVGKFLIAEPQLQDLVAGSGVVFSGGAAAWIHSRVTEVKSDLNSKNDALNQLRKELDS